MRALIALAGLTANRPVLAKLKESYLPDDLVIAADGGLNLLWAAGIMADWYCGDSDSVQAEALAAMRAHGLKEQQYPTAKDFTDGEAALEAALAAGCDDLLIWTSLGDCRPDHVLANVMTWATLSDQKNIPVWVTDGRQQLTFVTPNRALKLPADKIPLDWRSGYFSLVPLQGPCEGVTLRGLRYPLTEAEIPMGSTLGVSNRILPEADEVTVNLSGGIAAFYVVAEDQVVNKEKDG